jgi:hypothetical protein
VRAASATTGNTLAAALTLIQAAGGPDKARAVLATIEQIRSVV